MQQTTKKNIMATSLLALLVITFIIPTKNTKLIALLVLTLFFVLTQFYFKKRNVLTINKKQVFLVMICFGLLFLVLLYLPGIKFGFNLSAWARLGAEMLIYLVPIALIVVLYEFVRNALISQESKYLLVVSYIIGVVVDIIIFMPVGTIVSVSNLLNTLFTPFVMALSLNFLCTYVCKNFGCYPNIVYKLIVFSYIYIFPFVPVSPDIFEIVLNVLFPILVYYLLTIVYREKNHYIPKSKKRIFNVTISTILYVFMISVIMLISCQFKYCMLVIGSDSMKGTFATGDVIIYEKYDGQVLEKNQIIAFDKSGTLTIHRIIDVESINGQIRYTTKGDANEVKDDGYVVQLQIVGVVEFSIAYVGYPSILIQQIFK